MNDLLFYLTILALLYYFFYYLPSHQKLNANPPLQHNQQTQTETIIENEDQDLEKVIDQLIKNIQELKATID